MPNGSLDLIYLDPPYGIKFNSNFQWSTTSAKDMKDGVRENMSREPEMVRAFRDTWRDGIHSYLTYLRDRLTVARDLLHESGSIFVQIGDDNVHRVRGLMDEIFGEKNYISTISVLKTTSNTTKFIPSVYDSIVWFAKSIDKLKYNPVYKGKMFGQEGASEYTQINLPNGDKRPLTIQEKRGEIDIPNGGRVFQLSDLTSQSGGESTNFTFSWEGKTLGPGRGGWRTNLSGMSRLARAGRLRTRQIGNTIRYIQYVDDFAAVPLTNMWTDVSAGFNAYQQKIYVVQTNERIVERCILMATDPGDIVLDPTCGSGTTADMAEQWGRRWITIDTSRVSLALARSRLMGARYPYYLLADSPEGQRKDGEITRSIPKTTTTRGDIRHGFVYERVAHITLKSIANNSEIDVIYEQFQKAVEVFRASLNAALGKSWEEWEIPINAELSWPESAKAEHEKWLDARITRQKEIDASIAAKADSQLLYDKPYMDNGRIRVAGPFTVESLSPHRTLAVGEDGELIDTLEINEKNGLVIKPDPNMRDFAQMIIENLKAAGVQQAHKDLKISFTGLTGWPGHYICAEGLYMEGEQKRRAGILIGPEFGTVSRPDLVAAAREAGDAGFDVLIACAFNFDAHSSEFNKLGRVPVLKARMNPDLLMAKDLKTTATANLFVVFGEPDIQIEDTDDNMIRVKVFGVDVFKPQTGEIVSEGTDGIALWMVDTDYNEESFFVRHAYFLGANDPYKALKTTLKAEIDEAAWQSLYSDVSRPFPKPKSGRIAIKVINHLGDEVMKVFGV